MNITLSTRSLTYVTISQVTLQQCTRQVDSSVIVVRLFLLLSISVVAQQADNKLKCFCRMSYVWLWWSYNECKNTTHVLFMNVSICKTITVTFVLWWSQVFTSFVQTKYAFTPLNNVYPRESVSFEDDNSNGRSQER